LDGSEYAEKALDHAEELAKTFDAEIILFQVVPIIPIYAYSERVVFPIIDEKTKQSVERYLTNLADELKKRGLKVTAKVKTGLQVAAEIIDFAKESGVDLIVMCTHGHSGITLWAFGSVARKVITRAESPILLVHFKR
jgi:nucleotide-binding universal stress UspA family protein